MEYTIQELSRLSGVTTRALRWYDKIGLLKPSGRTGSGCRCYGPVEVDRLQDILYYRALGVELARIRECLDNPSFNRLTVLRGHLAALEEERGRIQSLIDSVKETIQTQERKEIMSDEKKFEAFKRQLVEEKERLYGAEAREKYGAAVSDSAARLAGMTEGEWTQMQEEERGYRQALLRAMAADDPAGEDAREAVRLHAAWLARYWPPESVTAQAHLGMAELYVQDRRFTEHYEKTAPGFAAFFLRAVQA